MKDDTDNKQLLLTFLKSQKVLILATVDENNHPYVCNLFMGVDDSLKIYFISSEKTNHSEHVKENSNVAFSTVWFDEHNHKNRKGIQGQGICRQANTEEEIKTGITLHNQKYPEFAERITVDWIKDNESQSKVWIIEPKTIKYWDDEYFGENGSCEIEF